MTEKVYNLLPAKATKLFACHPLSEVNRYLSNDANSDSRTSLATCDSCSSF